MGKLANLTLRVFIVLLAMDSAVGAELVEPKPLPPPSKSAAIDGVMLRRYFEKYARARLAKEPKLFVQYFVLPSSGEETAVGVSIQLQEELGLDPEGVVRGHVAVEEYVTYEAGKKLGQMLDLVDSNVRSSARDKYLSSKKFISDIEKQVFEVVKNGNTSHEEKLLALEVLGRALDSGNKDEDAHFQTMSLISSFKANDIMGNSEELRDIFIKANYELAKARDFGFWDRRALSGAFKDGLKVAERYYSEGLLESYLQDHPELQHKSQ